MVDKRFFRTITLKEAKGAAFVTGKRTCKGGTGTVKPPKPRPGLSSFGKPSLTVERRGKRVSETASTTTKRGSAAVYHSVTVNKLAASSFTIAADGRTAKVRGGGPITGSATFTSSSLMQDGAAGTLKGDLAVTFASLGRVALAGAAGLQANLTNPGFTPPVPPNQKPTASFSFDQDFGTRSVNFQDSSSDSDGTIASYAWAFGDGGTSTEAFPSHLYAAAGTYSVSLTVKDDRGGTATSTQSVMVTEPDAGGGERALRLPLAASADPTSAAEFVDAADDICAPVRKKQVILNRRLAKVEESYDTQTTDAGLNRAFRKAARLEGRIARNKAGVTARLAALPQPEGDRASTYLDARRSTRAAMRRFVQALFARAAAGTQAAAVTRTRRVVAAVKVLKRRNTAEVKLAKRFGFVSCSR